LHFKGTFVAFFEIPKRIVSPGKNSLGYSLTPQILTKREWSERDVELDTAMYLIRQLKP